MAFLLVTGAMTLFLGICVLLATIYAYKDSRHDTILE